MIKNFSSKAHQQFCDTVEIMNKSVRDFQKVTLKKREVGASLPKKYCTLSAERNMAKKRANNI